MEKKESQFAKKAWEKSYDNSVLKDKPKLYGSEYNPRKSKDRMKSFKPINSQDT